MIKIKRIYEPASEDDGFRILVDRLWPRGISKEEAAIDLWLKDIGPSNELRRWFSHDPKKYLEFKEKYQDELKSKIELVDQIKSYSNTGLVTLVYSAKDKEHNQAVILMEYIGS